MTEVKVQKLADSEKKSSLPVFKELEQVAERVRARAFELFSRRGFAGGHELDDWLAAEREICWPSGELLEQGRAFTLNVALPGFEAGDISVTATPRELIVHAKSKTEMKKENGRKSDRVCWSEFRSNDVYRRVDLPGEIDPQSASASLHNGLLQITATRVTQAPPRVIPISSAAA